MTAGPARRIVTLLPKNKPTPMAPPMAIMVSCLWLKRRRRPSTSGIGGWSVMTADIGRFTDHQIDVLFENVHDRLHIIFRVVDVERYPQTVVAVRCDDVIFRELLH